MRIQFSRSLLSLAVLAGLAALPAQSALISGTLNIGGSVAVTATEIDFLPLGGGDGLFIVDLFTQTGDFAPLAGTTGSVRDLDITTEPVGTDISLPNFLTFDAMPGLMFTLEFIVPGSNVPCGPQSCSPPGSPFNLENRPAGVAIDFGVRGTVSDGSGDLPSNFRGNFTTQLSNYMSYQEVLAAIDAGQPIQATYSANFVVNPIPEPGTISMLVLGGLMMAVPMIRKRRS